MGRAVDINTTDQMLPPLETSIATDTLKIEYV